MQNELHWTLLLLCEFPAKELTLIVVHGFGEELILLLFNLNMKEKKRCVTSLPKYICSDGR